MGLGYYGAKLIYGINLSKHEVYRNDEDDLYYINDIKFDNDEELEIIETGDDNTDVFILNCGSQTLQGGGVWDDGGKYSIDQIKNMCCVDDKIIKKICAKYKISETPSFGIYLSCGQCKY